MKFKKGDKLKLKNDVSQIHLSGIGIDGLIPFKSIIFVGKNSPGKINCSVECVTGFGNGNLIKTGYWLYEDWVELENPEKPKECRHPLTSIFK
jgi:hypothetical protein